MKPQGARHREMHKARAMSEGESNGGAGAPFLGGKHAFGCGSALPRLMGRPSRSGLPSRTRQFDRPRRAAAHRSSASTMLPAPDPWT